MCVLHELIGMQTGVSAHSGKCRASHEHSGTLVCSEGQYVGITPGRKEIPLFVRQGLIDHKMTSNLVPCQGRPWTSWSFCFHLPNARITGICEPPILMYALLDSSYIKSEYKTEEFITSSFKVNTCLPYDLLEKWMSTQACSCWHYSQYISEWVCLHKCLLISN